MIYAHLNCVLGLYAFQVCSFSANIKHVYNIYTIIGVDPTLCECDANVLCFQGYSLNIITI